MCESDAVDVTGSADHRAVLRRLVELAADQHRLVTPTELTADSPIDLGGVTYPIGTRPPHLVNVLDDLVRVGLAERIVPTAGESSYRPTELGREELDDFDE